MLIAQFGAFFSGKGEKTKAKFTFWALIEKKKNFFFRKIVQNIDWKYKIEIISKQTNTFYRKMFPTVSPNILFGNCKISEKKNKNLSFFLNTLLHAMALGDRKYPLFFLLCLNETKSTVNFYCSLFFKNIFQIKCWFLKS